MNRADLSWALSAVLPHIGSSNDGADFVGLDRYRDSLYAFTCNRYSTAIARISEPADIHAALPRSEAQELERFVRPGRKLTEEQELVYAQRPLELHIGWDEIEDKRGVIPGESGVFDILPFDPPIKLTDLFDRIGALYDAPKEWHEIVFNADLMERFARAKRGEFSRLRFYPRHVIDRNGAAVVTVGTEFIGAVAGLAYDLLGPSIVADLLPDRSAVA